MCGIAGCVNYERNIDERELGRMTRALRHRGPDGEGFFVSPIAGLGHRRLAIVDLDGGVQPIANEDGRVRAVVNGEIYNHLSLRAELQAHGHLFRTRSDSEVIVHLYESAGWDGVGRLDAEIAFALWDQSEQRLVLARDRMGVKPLYFVHRGRALWFASEAKAFFAAGVVSAEVDPRGLRDVFTYGQPMAPGTFWKGVRELLPGHVALFDRRGLRVHRYAYPPQQQWEDLRTDANAVRTYRTAIEAAVSKRIPNEVRWGSTLSGGLDSTAVTALASRIAPDVSTYTIRLLGDRLDEGAYSRQASRALRVANREIATSGESVVKDFDATLYHLETPQWFGVAFPFYALARSARADGFKVALTGDGADEILGGYPFYALASAHSRLRRWNLDRLLGPLLRVLVRWADVPEGAHDHFAKVLGGATSTIAELGGWPAWKPIWDAMRPLGDELLGNATEPSPLVPASAGDPLRRSTHFELGTRLSGWVLPLADRLGMAHGVEVRVPFMDQNLVALTSQLRPDMLLRGTKEKWILREACRDLVPTTITRRRKKPFFTPITPWFLSGPGERLVEEYLSQDAVRNGGLFDPRGVARVLHRARRGKTWSDMVASWAALGVMSSHAVVKVLHAAH